MSSCQITTPNNYDMLFTFFIGIFGGAILAFSGGMVLGALLDEDTVANQIHIKYPDALKLLIKEKKKNAINVGIFKDEKNEIEPSLEITSEKGVSDNLYVGQVIYL